MTLLWISAIVCAAVLATIALRWLERERRLFFASRPMQRRAEPAAGDGLRRVLAGARDRLIAISTPGRQPMHSAAEERRSVPGALLDGWRREHAAQIVLRAMSAPEAPPPPPPMAPAAVCPPEPAAPRPAVTDHPSATGMGVAAVPAAGQGIVRVDAGGQLHLPDAMARDFLQWTTGTLSLSDILAGGHDEAAALLESIGRLEVVEQTVSVVIDGAFQPLRLTALAARRSDGTLDGALLILRRP